MHETRNTTMLTLQCRFDFFSKCAEAASVSKCLVKQEQLVTSLECNAKGVGNTGAIYSAIKAYLFVHFTPSYSMC